MGLAEQWTRDQQHADDRAQAVDEEIARRETSYAAEFDGFIKARNLSARTGIKNLPALHDVLSEASCDAGIFLQLMQGLVHCAAKGQIEAVESLEKVKELFVTERLREDRIAA